MCYCNCFQPTGLLDLTTKNYQQIDHFLLFYWNVSHKQYPICRMIRYDFGFCDCQTKEEEQLLLELYYTFFMEVRKDILLFKKISILKDGLDKISIPFELSHFFPPEYYSSIQSFFVKYPHILYNHVK